MVSVKIRNLLAIVVISFLLLNAGCSSDVRQTVKPEAKVKEALSEAKAEELPLKAEIEKPMPAVKADKPILQPKKQIPQVKAPKTITEKPATFELKFIEGDLTTYKVITENSRAVEFEGDIPEKANLSGGVVSTKIEIVFDQQIQSIDPNGNAMAKITIKEFKYLARGKNRITSDLDSTDEKKSSLIGRLIGRSYTIEISPAGEVITIVDANQLQKSLKSASFISMAVIDQLDAKSIRLRHDISGLLPDNSQKQLQKADNWNSIKTFSFGLLGAKSYERVYTIDKIEAAEDSLIALIRMEAIPSSETAEELHIKDQASETSDMIDNAEQYHGLLQLNLTDGKIEKYSEKLQSEWVIMVPSSEKKDTIPPALIMRATRIYRLKRIDK